MAAFDWSECFETGIENAEKVATIRCLEPLFKNVVASVMALAAVGLFVMLVIGGFNFLFSGGDAKKLEQAKGTLSASILGLVVIVMAYLILNTIKIFTGVDVTTFEVFTR